MIWVAPTEKDTATGTLEKRFRNTADQLRANSVSNARASKQEIWPKLIESLAKKGLRLYVSPVTLSAHWANSDLRPDSLEQLRKRGPNLGGQIAWLASSTGGPAI